MTTLRRSAVQFALLSCSLLRVTARILPSRLVLAFGSAMGELVGRFCARDREISVAQLRFAGYSGGQDAGSASGSSQPVKGWSEDAHTVTRNAFRHMGTSIAELIIWERFFGSLSITGCGDGKGRDSDASASAGSNPDDVRVASIDHGIFQELRDSGSGALGLSGHFGSFELLAAFLAKQGLPCSVIARSPNYPALANAIRELRRAYGVDVIWSESADAPRQIIQAMRRGQIICALVDQDTKFKSEFAPFFGVDAASPSGPIALALRHKLPIFTSFIRRTGHMHHEVTTTRIDPCAYRSSGCKGVLQVFNSRLEEMICRDPSQYIWWHRRWRRRPGTDYDARPELLPSRMNYLAWLAESPRAADMSWRH